MNQEIKEKWIIELESGNYKKGRSRLKQKEGEKVVHCCLGVLCELFIKETGLGEWKDFESGVSVFVINGEESRDYLPKEVQVWAGLSNQNGIFNFPPEEEMDTTMKGLHKEYGTINLALVNDVREDLPYYDSGYNTVKGYIKKYF